MDLWKDLKKAERMINETFEYEFDTINTQRTATTLVGDAYLGERWSM